MSGGDKLLLAPGETAKTEQRRLNGLPWAPSASHRVVQEQRRIGYDLAIDDMKAMLSDMRKGVTVSNEYRQAICRVLEFMDDGAHEGRGR